MVDTTLASWWTGMLDRSAVQRLIGQCMSQYARLYIYIYQRAFFCKKILCKDCPCLALLWVLWLAWCFGFNLSLLVFPLFSFLFLCEIAEARKVLLRDLFPCHHFLHLLSFSLLFSYLWASWFAILYPPSSIIKTRSIYLLRFNDLHLLSYVTYWWVYPC